MGSHITLKTDVSGSGNGPCGWFQLNHATVYFDHPYHAPLDHSLHIVFIMGASHWPTGAARAGARRRSPSIPPCQPRPLRVLSVT